MQAAAGRGSIDVEASSPSITNPSGGRLTNRMQVGFDFFVSYQTVARATRELAIDIQNMLNDESALICYSEGGPSSFSY